MSNEAHPAMTSSNRRIVLGEITGAHGLKGELRVRVAGDSPDHLLSVSTVWIGRRPDDPEARRWVVQGGGPGRGDDVRIALEGVTSREQVQPLVGLLITTAPEQLDPLPEGEFYWFELIGCRVETESGEFVGHVREIWETGAHDVLLVENEDGLRRLLPTAEELMTSIDREAKRIVVVDLPGLLEPV